MTHRLGLSLLLFTLCLNTRAQADVIERVVAVVNDEAIFLSELRQRAYPFLAQIAQAPSETQRLGQLERVYSDVLAAMIDEEVLLQTAEQANVTVTSDEVDRAMRNIRQQNSMDQDEFIEALQDQGLSLAQYRKTLKKQLIRLKLINERVRGRVNITDEQVRREYEDRVRTSGGSLRFRVSHIVFPLSENASAREVARVRDSALDAHKDLKAENFEKAMTEHGGAELGWLTQGDLPSEFESALLAINRGEISKPVRGSAGYHIFLLHERDTSSDLPPLEEAKDQIFRELLDQAMERQQSAFLDELRRKAEIRRML